jgi:hypothetical protein
MQPWKKPSGFFLGEAFVGYLDDRADFYEELQGEDIMN